MSAAKNRRRIPRERFLLEVSTFTGVKVLLTCRNPNPNHCPGDIVVTVCMTALGGF